MLAEAISIDIGPGLKEVALAAIAAGGAWIGTRKVRKEMGNNGGSSLRDAIDRIERKVDVQGRRLDAAGIPQVAEDLPPPAPNTPTPKETDP